MIGFSESRSNIAYDSTPSQALGMLSSGIGYPGDATAPVTAQRIGGFETYSIEFEVRGFQDPGVLPGTTDPIE